MKTPMRLPHNKFRGIVVTCLGVTLSLVGILVNKWSVEVLLVPDRNLSGTVSILILYLSQILAIVFGVWMAWVRPSWMHWAPTLIAIPVTGAIAIAGAVGSVRAMLPPAWESEGMPMVQRLKFIADTTYADLGEVGINHVRFFLDMPGLSNSKELRLRHAVRLLEEGYTPQAILAMEALRSDLVKNEADEKARELLTILQDYMPVAYLRLAEQANCLGGAATSETCIVPFTLNAVHEKRVGANLAIDALTAILKHNPADRNSRWLLNIAHMALGSYPEAVPEEWRIPPDAFNSEYEIERFQDIAPALGVNPVGLAGGAIVEDFDQDGDLDIMTSSSGPQEQIRLYSNNGDGGFTDRTIEAGLSGQVDGLNMTHADYNNDGYPDVLILRGGWRGFVPGNGSRPNSLLRNNGDGTFSDVTETTGLLSYHPTQTAAWGDFNNDGWLDLFIGNESFNKDYHRSELFVNNADGTFKEVSASRGLNIVGMVKGVAWGDYDNDGWLDLYVSRFGDSNQLFRNLGNSAGAHQFQDVTAEGGVGEPGLSFPTWFWDYDNDGWLDIFVAGFYGTGGGTSYLSAEPAVHGPRLDDITGIYLGEPTEHSEVPRLYRNNGDGTFREVSRELSLDRVILVMGANYGDLDNDGYPDLYLGTGEPSYRALLPNRMFRNDRGASFQDVTSSGGFGHIQKGHGIAFGDLDNDGDQDVYAQMGGWFPGDGFQNSLFENPGTNNHWITLRLTGVESNRAGIGARVRLSLKTPEGSRDVHALVGTGGSFGSSSLQQEIGLGNATGIELLEIRWHGSGSVQRFNDVPLDRIIRIQENQTSYELEKFHPFRLGESTVSTNKVPIMPGSGS